MSYSDQHKAYRLIDVVTNKGMFIWDVVIDENARLFQPNLDHIADLKISEVGCEMAEKFKIIRDEWERYTLGGTILWCWDA